MSTPETYIPNEDIPEVSPQLQIPEREPVKEVPISVINGALEELIHGEQETPDVKRPPTIH